MYLVVAPTYERMVLLERDFLSAVAEEQARLGEA
jgi:hypothetical protein